MIAKHVDDIKVTGEPQEVKLLMDELEHVFGKLTVTKDEFTNCGVHHKKHQDGSITLDQNEYIQALMIIKHPELSNTPETPASEELLSLYRSLLGAVAYTLLTQHQIACYIIALQRVTHKLTVGDVKKLNIVTSKVKESPATLTFRPLVCNQGTLERLTVFSDAGFRKEEHDGYALRGALYIRHTEPLYRDDGSPTEHETLGHVILADAKSIKTVCRSVYAAKLMSAATATDLLIPLTVTLHEIKCGPLGTEKLRMIREVGWTQDNDIRTQVVIDAKSVYESLKVKVFKPLADNSLSRHVLWMREMIEKRLVSTLVCADTKDMYANGLTKGIVPRNALLEILSGILRLRYSVDSFTRCERRTEEEIHFMFYEHVKNSHSRMDSLHCKMDSLFYTRKGNPRLVEYIQDSAARTVENSNELEKCILEDSHALKERTQGMNSKML